MSVEEIEKEIELFTQAKYRLLNFVVFEKVVELYLIGNIEYKLTELQKEHNLALAKRDGF